LTRLIQFGCIALVAVGSLACDPSVVIEAQTLPVQIGADLQPPTQSGNVTVTGYRLVLDGVPIQKVPVASCPGPAKCTVTFPVGTLGLHALAYSTIAVLLDVDPTSEVDSTPGPATSFRVQQAGAAPTQAPTVHKAGS
jgi:hypothetical protein